MARSLTAEELQRQHGDLLREARFQQCSTGYLLAQALTQMQPPIRVSVMAASVWLTKYKVPEGAQVVASADAFEQQYGRSMSHPYVKSDNFRPLCWVAGLPITILNLTIRLVDWWFHGSPQLQICGILTTEGGKAGIGMGSTRQYGKAQLPATPVWSRAG